MERTRLRMMRRNLCGRLVGVALVAAALIGAETANGKEKQESLDCVIEPSMLVSVGSQADGVLENVLVNRGDVVERDQLLATLDDELERAAEDLYRARASTDVSIRWSNVKADFGARSANRLRKLGAASAASAHEVDEAVTDERLSRLKNEEAKVNRRLAELEHRRAQAALGHREINSPVRAVVVERLMHPGERVTDEPILTLAAIDVLHVEVIVPISMFGKIRLGTRAEVRPEEPVGGQYSATVSVVDKVMDARSGTFGVRLALPNAEHALPAGLRCKISFDLEAAPVQAVAPGTSEPVKNAGVGRNEAEAAGAEPTPVAAPGPLEAKPETTTQTMAEPVHLADRAPATAAAPSSPPKALASESLASKLLASAIPSAKASASPAVKRSAAPRASAALASEPATDPARSDEQPGACVEFGPFDDLGQASALGLLMRERGSENVVRETVSGKVKGYLLLVPITGSEEAAVADLKTKGIRDLQVLRRGPNAGHVSLGYHTRLDSAERHHRTLSARGISVKLAERRDRKSHYWIGFDTPRPDDHGRLARRLLALEPASTIRDVACIALRQAAL